jgi:hypothetical protein
MSLKEKNKIKETCETTYYSYEDYLQKKINLYKFKIPELKSIAKKNKLHITGTKGVLIERINSHFNNFYNAIKIQKIFRGFLVRLSFKIRGPAYKDITKCVNETDGYTLEPLNEIPYERLFTYMDSKNFIYGFDLVSLITVFRNKGKIINPYTRERFDINTLNNILSLENISRIIYPDFFKDLLPINDIIKQNSQTTNRQPIINNRNFTNEQRELFIKMQEMRNMTINERIQNLFIEIDILGNYTQSSWFSNLERIEYVRFYRCLFEIWNYRAAIMHETKRQICQLHDPFLNVRYPSIDMPIDTLRDSCLTVMENMVYTGINLEYRKIGALHVLTALTCISIPCRNSLIWLYESLL